MKTLSPRQRERLDDVDLELLRILQSNGRITNADLARRVGLSPPSVLQRVRKLEESGLVSRYAAILCAERLGYNLQVVAMISLALHQEKPIEGFRKAVLEIPEVLQCLHVSGDFDYLLKIVIRDMAEYEKLVTERLSAIPGVGKIQSSFVLAVTKDTTSLPL
ncbi:MAG: Lrp/AsnC family transcriptional regulator [Armatimonadetes bacterium]|nr:Lrp/AsnC family transcriptional regulator [Armatimonadota bacterium]